MRIGLEYGKVLQRIENIQSVCVGSTAGRAQAIRNTQVQQPFVIGSGNLSPGWWTMGEDKISRSLAMAGLPGVGQAWICRNSGQMRRLGDVVLVASLLTVCRS